MFKMMKIIFYIQKVRVKKYILEKGKLVDRIVKEEDLKKMREYANDEEILLHRDKDLVRKLYL